MTTPRTFWTPEKGEIVVTVDGQGRVEERLIGLVEPTFMVHLFKEGVSGTYGISELRERTAMEFLFSPVGFGKWTWGQFVSVQVAYGALLGTGIGTWSDGGWFAVVFWTVAQVVMLTLQLRGRGRKQ